MTELENLFAKCVTRTAPYELALPCRIWRDQPNRYPMFKGKRPNRWVWELVTGCPPRLFICHHCDIKGCIEPTHLFEGDNQANILDLHRKMRLGLLQRKGLSYVRPKPGATIQPPIVSLKLRCIKDDTPRSLWDDLH